MKEKGLKGYLEWMVLTLYILLIIGVGVRLSIGQQIGVYLGSDNFTYTLNQNLSVSNNTGANTFGIFIDNDTVYPFNDLTINATLRVEQTISTSDTITSGIFANSAIEIEEGAQVRPIGNLTITDRGIIQVSANGKGVAAGGIAVGNVTDNLINDGVISVSGNVTDSSGQLLIVGIYASNTTNVVNYGNLTVSGVGGYVDYAENNVPSGIDIKWLGNFTNTGNIDVSIKSTNATAAGIRSYDIGYFNNTGEIRVITNSTIGDFSEVVGVMAGKPELFDGLESGHIGVFGNSGNLTVRGYADGGDLEAIGVAVFNGTIDEFRNLEGGKIEVYGKNSGGYIHAYGVYAQRDISSFSSAGTISISANATDSNAWAYGVKAKDICNFTLVSVGTINVIANATNGGAEAYGVEVDNINNFVLEDGSKISATAIANATTNEAAEASGVSAADIGMFTNAGEISVNATSTNWWAFASGVKAHSIDNFINEGTINVSANATNEYAEAYGVDAESIDNFDNNGTIDVNATVGNVKVNNSEVDLYAYGIYLSSGYGNVRIKNTGRITVTAEAGNALGYESGVNTNVQGVYANNVGNFTNLGNITASAKAGSAIGNNSSVNAEELYVKGVTLYNVDKFTNFGNITASSEAWDALGENSYVYAYDVYGVEAVFVDIFTNLGNITASAEAGNAVRNSSRVKSSDVCGVDVHTDNFANFGNIIASAKVGNAVGDSSQVRVSQIYGVRTSNPVNLTNERNIITKILAGDAMGSNSALTIDYVRGIYAEGGVNSFLNEGLIYVETFAGSAFVTNSTVTIKDIIGVYAEDISSGNLLNKGIIKTSVKGGSGSKIGEEEAGIAGILVSKVNEASIVNEGLIYVDVNAPNAKSIENIAGVVVSNSSNVTISNPGTIWLSIFGPKAENVRTLWIEGSDVTLDKSFSIVFGSPGINPSTNSTENLSQRPIYVDSSSTLNLNGANLIARIDSRNLKFNAKYYLIDNDNGAVIGEWGNLVKTWTNPEVKVSWTGEDKGENSAVMFGYVPGVGSMTSAMGYTASWIISSGIANMLRFDPTLVFGLLLKDYRPVMVASSANVVGGAPVYYKKGLFFLPLYTRVEANDLGFDADAYGFTLGFEGELFKDLTATLYGGYSRVNLDYKTTGPKEEDQDLYVGGFSFRYAPKPYFVRFLANCHWADHDYKGLTGGNYELKEKADYESWGIDMELTGGYIFRSGNFYIAPEIGLGYTYYKADDFHTEVPSAPQWNRYYETERVDFLKGILGLYLGGSDKSERIRFYSSLRLEQSFGDNDVSVISYLPGLPKYKLEKDISNTTFVGQVGINFKLGKQWTLDLSGRGDFNGDYSAYSGRAMLKVLF